MIKLARALLLPLFLLTACQSVDIKEDRVQAGFKPSGTDSVAWLKPRIERHGGGQGSRLAASAAELEPMIVSALAEYNTTVNAANSPADWRIDYRLVQRFKPSKEAGQAEEAQAPRMHDPVGTGFDLRGDDSRRIAGVWHYTLHISAYSGFQEKPLWFGRVDEIPAPDGVEELPASRINAAVKALIGRLYGAEK